MSMQFSARSSIRFETLATENWRHRDNAFSVSPCLCVPIGANGVRGEARGMLSLHLPGPLHIISVFWQPERGGYHEEDIPAQQQPAKKDPRISRAHVDQRGPAGSETSSGERAKEADREWLEKPTKDFLKDIEYLDLRTTREFTIAAGRCIREVSSSSGWRIVWSITGLGLRFRAGSEMQWSEIVSSAVSGKSLEGPAITSHIISISW